MLEGWVKLQRSIFHDPLMRRDHTYLAIYLWLFTRATHGMERDEKGHWQLLAKEKRYKVRFHGQSIPLGPGQLLCGSQQIGQELGIPESTVRRKLALMKREGLIERQYDNHSSLVTFINWKEEQSGDRPNERQVSGNQSSDEQLVITNKDDETNDTKENTSNEVGPTALVSEEEYGDKGVNHLLKLMQAHLPLPTMDGSRRRNRSFATNLLQKYRSQVHEAAPDFTDAEIEEKVFVILEETLRVAANSDYWVKRITSVQALFNHSLEIYNPANP
jgi:hypothetical protein